jgi:Zn-dependent protease with chaperone function
VTLLALLLPLGLCAGYGALGPRLLRRGPPALAARLLTLGGLAAGVCSFVSLGLLGFAFLAQLPDIAQRGHWSAAALRAASPVSRGVAFVALAALGVVTLAAVWVIARRVWAVHRTYRACRRMARSSPTGLVVLDDERLMAYAVPGRPGRIVVSRDLLSRLDRNERRVLLAHEQAHLDNNHHWYQAGAAIAAALNPLLTPLVPAVELALERWADEAAATDIGSRSRVASALGRVALLRLHAEPAVPPAAFGVTSHLALRMRAMLDPPPRVPRVVVGALVASLVLTAATTAGAGERMEGMIDTARSAVACHPAGALPAKASSHGSRSAHPDPMGHRPCRIPTRGS